MELLTGDRLEELLQIANAATCGPLEVTEGDCHGDEENRWSVVKDVDGAMFFIATIENGAPGDTLNTERANAELFAASRTAIPALVAEIRELREINALIHSGLRWTGDGYEWTGAEFDYRIKPEEAVAKMQQQRESMRSIIADLVEFDRSYPKGQVYSAHEKEPERALDAIIDRAKSMLAR